MNLLSDAVDFVGAALPSIPDVAIVLGSGMAALESDLVDPVIVTFDDVPGLPSAGVQGHEGRFVFGRLGATAVLLQAGRLHVYEGHAMDVVVAPVRILAGLGVRTLLMTNAVGGIHPLLGPGDIVLVDDQINWSFRGALVGPVVGDEPRFPDMSAPFDVTLQRQIRGAASDLGIALARGTYAGVLGPAYETAAEVRMLARLGGDVVGMSTVPEVTTAHALGLRVAVISLVTNKATGLSGGGISHEDVLETGQATADQVVRLIFQVASRLSDGGVPGQSTAAK